MSATKLNHSMENQMSDILDLIAYRRQFAKATKALFLIWSFAKSMHQDIHKNQSSIKKNFKNKIIYL
jgi:hypothetical protein